MLLFAISLYHQAIQHKEISEHLPKLADCLVFLLGVKMFECLSNISCTISLLYLNMNSE